MKKIIIAFAMLTAFNLSAQIEVKEAIKEDVVWTNGKSLLPELVHSHDSKISFYAFFYENEKYHSITDVQYLVFKTKDEAILFFNLVDGVFKDKQNVSLTIKDDDYMLSFSTSRVMVYSQLSYFYLSQKEVTEILTSLNK